MEALLTEYKETLTNIREFRREVVLVTTILITGSFAGLNFVFQSGLMWNFPFLIGFFFFFGGWLLGVYKHTEVSLFRKTILLRGIDNVVRNPKLLTILDESIVPADETWDRRAVPLIYVQIATGASLSMWMYLGNLGETLAVIVSGAFFSACAASTCFLFFRSSKKRKRIYSEIESRLAMANNVGG